MNEEKLPFFGKNVQFVPVESSPYVYLYSLTNFHVSRQIQDALIKRWAQLTQIPLYVGLTFRREFIEQPNCLGWCGFFATPEILESLKNSPCPVINFSNRLGKCDSALNMFVDDEEMSRMAGTYLIKKGYKHFAFIGQEGHRYSHDRSFYFREFLQQNGKTMQEFNFPNPGPSNPIEFSKGRKMLAATWLREFKHPTAILAANDDTITTFQNNLKDVGLSLGPEHQIVGVDNSLNETNGKTSNFTTSIRPNFEGLGQAVAEKLFKIIKREADFTPGTVIRIKGAKLIEQNPTQEYVSSDPLVNKLIDQIAQEINKGEAPRVESIARAFATTPRNLLIRFDKAMGLSLRDYILRERLKRAANMLIKTDQNIADIAYACGFSKQGALSSHFLKHYGCNPRDYRKQH